MTHDEREASTYMEHGRHEDLHRLARGAIRDVDFDDDIATRSEVLAWIDAAAEALASFPDQSVRRGLSIMADAINIDDNPRCPERNGMASIDGCYIGPPDDPAHADVRAAKAWLDERTPDGEIATLSGSDARR